MIMKNIRLTLILLIMFLSNIINAQSSKCVMARNLNNNCIIRYYYYPNLQAYYDNQNKVFIYQDENKWKKSEELPNFYGGYSIYKHVRVLIKDFDDDNPESQIAIHKKDYPYCSNGRFTYTFASN